MILLRVCLSNMSVIGLSASFLQRIRGPS